MASQANLGKDAESLLRDFLTEMSRKLHTAFMRLPDARAGSRQPTLADFLVVSQGKAFLLECKETEHTYRLAHNNFAADQVARMRRWELAGANSYTLVYHSTLKLWRGYRVDRFLPRDGGSWDLRDTEPTTLKNTFELLKIDLL